jgi:hypothetical protein
MKQICNFKILKQLLKKKERKEILIAFPNHKNIKKQKKVTTYKFEITEIHIVSKTFFKRKEWSIFLEKKQKSHYVLCCKIVAHNFHQ